MSEQTTQTHERPPSRRTRRYGRHRSRGQNFRAYLFADAFGRRFLRTLWQAKRAHGVALFGSPWKIEARSLDGPWTCGIRYGNFKRGIRHGSISTRHLCVHLIRSPRR